MLSGSGVIGLIGPDIEGFRVSPCNSFYRVPGDLHVQSGLLPKGMKESFVSFLSPRQACIRYERRDAATMRGHCCLCKSYRRGYDGRMVSGAAVFSTVVLVGECRLFVCEGDGRSRFQGDLPAR